MALDAPSTEDRFSLPTRLGRYRILTPLGSGGMAMVLLARAEGIGGFERDVAIKVLHPHLMEDEGLVSQFLKEARIAARIRHPNVVPVLDVGRHAQGVHLVMEYVQGDSLHGLARRAQRQGEQLSPSVWMRMIADALLGLHAAHELTDEQGAPLGVIHRDFTPHNILVGTDGVGRLCDFGVVKVVASSDRTATGIVKGKLRYLAPEQVRARPLDRRCDVWAAGVTVWELFTGKPLHDQRDQVDVLLSIAVEPPPRLRTLLPDISPAVDDAVAWALTIDPDERCPSAETFRERLLEAWEPDHGLASQQQVASSVQRLCADRIEELRGKMERFSHLLDEMGDLVQPLESDPTPSGEGPGLMPRTRQRGPTTVRATPAARAAAKALADGGPEAASELGAAEAETATIPIRRQMGEPAARAAVSGQATPPGPDGAGAEIPTAVSGESPARAAADDEAGGEIPTMASADSPSRSTAAAVEDTDAEIPTAASSPSPAGASAEDTDAEIPTALAPAASSTAREDTEAEIPTAVAASAASAQETARGSDAARLATSPHPGRTRLMGVGAAVLVLAAIGAAAWQLTASPPQQTVPSSDPLTPASASSAPPTTPSTAAPTALAKPVQLVVEANAPIVELRLDGMVVPLEGPSRRITVPLDRPAGSQVTVRAKSADGRKLEQECLVREGALRIDFPSPSRPGSRRIAPASPYE